MKKEINYLENKPTRPSTVKWHCDEKEMVTIEKENKGFFNRAAQLLLKKPKISYIHFDEIGSIVYPLLDGQRTVQEIGEILHEKLGDSAEPLFERLIPYLLSLKNLGFIEM